MPDSASSASAPSSPARGDRPSGKHQIVFWSLAAAAVAADLVTKGLAFSLVGEGAPGRPRPVSELIPGVIRIVCHRNKGVAFGMFHSYPTIHIFISGAICVFLVYLYYSPKTEPADPSGGAPANATAKSGKDADKADKKVEPPAAPWTRWHDAAIGLILAGAIGNVIDRAWLGRFFDRDVQQIVPGVRDFISVYVGFVYTGGPTASGWWPTFNVADTYITVGVGVYVTLLVVDTVRHRRSRNTPAQAEVEKGVG
jgi:lipoprotein signal peptidase